MTGLDPNERYSYEIFQSDLSPEKYANVDNIITVNGINMVITHPSTSDNPTTTGLVSADENGQIIFLFYNEGSGHIHLSAINLQRNCSKYMT